MYHLLFYNFFFCDISNQWDVGTSSWDYPYRIFAEQKCCSSFVNSLLSFCPIFISLTMWFTGTKSSSHVQEKETEKSSVSPQKSLLHLWWSNSVPVKSSSVTFHPGSNMHVYLLALGEQQHLLNCSAVLAWQRAFCGLDRSYQHRWSRQLKLKLPLLQSHIRLRQTGWCFSGTLKQIDKCSNKHKVVIPFVYPPPACLIEALHHDECCCLIIASSAIRECKKKTSLQET